MREDEVGKLLLDTLGVERGSTVRGVDVVRGPRLLCFWLPSFVCLTNSLGGCRSDCTKRNLPTLIGTRADRIAGTCGRLHPALWFLRNFVSTERLLWCAPPALVSPVAVRSGEVRCAVVWCVVVCVWCVCVCVFVEVCACVWVVCGGGVCGCVWMGGVWVR